MKELVHSSLANILFGIVCLIPHLASAQSISFESADLEVPYSVCATCPTNTLIGYPSNRNKTSQSLSEKRWYSFGIPRFVRNNNGKIFSIEKVGDEYHLSLTIRLLNELHRQALADKATKIYANKKSTRITTDQILFIPLKYLRANISIQVAGKRRIFRGRSKNLTSDTRIVFTLSQRDAMLLKNLIKQGIDINCTLGFSALQVRTNTIQIRSEELKEIRFKNKILGHGNRAYVTRKQLGKLSGMLYRRLQIFERYQIDGVKFSNKFISDLLFQTNQGSFSHVDFITAIRSLSSFLVPNLKRDLQPSQIRREMSKIFKVEKIAGKEYLKLAKGSYHKSKSKNELHVETNGSASVPAVFKVSLAADYVKKNQALLISKRKTLRELLNVINRNKSSDIIWKRDGNTIVPKSVSVALFTKATFRKKTVISRQLIQETKAKYEREIVLHTKRNISPVATWNKEKAIFYKIQDNRRFTQERTSKILNQHLPNALRTAKHYTNVSVQAHRSETNRKFTQSRNQTNARFARLQSTINACFWTKVIGKGPSLPKWAVRTCPSNYVMTGISFSHPYSQDLTYQERYRIRCCRLFLQK